VRLVCLCVCGIVWLCGPATAADATVNATNLPLTDLIPLPDQTLPFQESAELTLPALAAKPGRIIVLAFKAVSYSKGPSGCNYNATLKMNDTALGRFTTGGSERLMGRPAMFQFVDTHRGVFPVFSGARLMVLFAPDAATGDGMTSDKLGATFALDISDVARGVDGNTLTFVNTRVKSALAKRLDLIVTDLRVGWLDKALIPKVPSRVPERGPIAKRVSAAGLELAQGAGGGFTVAGGDGLRLRVETAIGMDGKMPSDLTADDQVGARAKVTIAPYGETGYEMTAEWAAFRLRRTVTIENGLVVWKERWTNTGEAIAGLPFRHRIFLDGEDPKCWIGGDPDMSAVAGMPKNPTLFLQSRKQPGHGMGVTAESDWLRLLMWARVEGGVAEIYSGNTALPAKGSIDFELTITPVTDGGSYWGFINRVRERWGLNKAGVPYPIFWSYARTEQGNTPEERLRNALGHLGPVVIAHGGWARLTADSRIVRAGRYPKLPEGAPRTPGPTPDLDLDAFLTFQHREAYWKQYRLEVERLHEACPDVKVIKLMHPAMEVAYRPLKHRWPYAACEIATAAGGCFQDAHYSRAHLGDAVDKGWGVLYYCPRPGSRYLAALLRDVRRAMDECGGDGIYFDEFSWGGATRGYSRYDYGRWDGYSADLDKAGKVVRLKADNAHIAEVSQLQIVREVLVRNKLFLGNGTGVLRSVNQLPVARFTEGGNGHGKMASGHLANVPLVLGNFGSSKTRKDVFKNVKECLEIGAVYSPMPVNLLLEGPDNFVCKLYPITVRTLGAGTILGKERLITSKPGTFAWPGKQARARMYIYDESGDLKSKNIVALMAGENRIALAAGELVIAELIP
jgi:hypothetical protein